MPVLNFLSKAFLGFHYRKLCKELENPIEYQRETLATILSLNKNTEWAKAHGLGEKSTYAEFADRVPCVEYEALRPSIERMQQGEYDVLCGGRVKMFSKSSGTTGGKSKFLPVTQRFLENCHIKGPRDLMGAWLNENPESSLFKANSRSIIMGGTLQEVDGAVIGDISALMLHNTPSFFKQFIFPNVETLMLPKWEEKIELIAGATLNENLVSFGGVPTWTLVLIKRLLELGNKDDLSDIFPNLELYMHGGVSFAPYLPQFQQLIKNPNFQYRQIYNASEGFFAAQLTGESTAMSLLVNNGIFYEFIKFSDYQTANQIIIPLEQVEPNVNYVMLITTISGLYRYLVGDTVRFESVSPHYKLQVTGRTKHYINAFGEELMVENTDTALARVCLKHQVLVNDYTVAPVYMTAKNDTEAGHQWLIEFEVEPASITQFAAELDQELQALNSDYEAKRYQNIAMKNLKITPLPPNSFNQWLKRKGKLGGQHKVPRLLNDRSVVDDLLNSLNYEGS